MKKVALCLFFLPLLLLPALAQGHQPIQRQLIRMQAATFDPLVDGEPAVASIGTQSPEAAGPYYIVQFKAPVEQIWVRQLDRLGAELLGYIPDNAHIARIQPADVEKVRQMYAVRWVGPYRPGYKLAPALADQTRTAAAQAAVEVYVVGFRGESLPALRAFLASQRATIADAAESEIGITFRVTLPPAALPQLALNPAISWVEPYVPLKLDNAEARKIMNVQHVWENKRFFGAGQIVAVSDSGLSVQTSLSPDFGPAGRLKRAFAPSEMNLSDQQCRQKTNWTDLNGHGTHVAGSVLGNGSASGGSPATHAYSNSHAGNAPEAQLVFMALNTDGSGGIQCVSSNGDFIAKGYEQGARISSNSWGGGSDGSYGILSSIVDNYIWNHKDYTVLFAAGNSGPGSATIGSPGSAKNIITIGASENNRPGRGSSSDDPNTMAGFSSRGPTTDGRIKPDIVAPGTSIISVLGAQAGPDIKANQIAPGVPYAVLQGTSMATPLAAGATTLAREWLGKERGMANPSAAFMKALMIHGAFRLPGAAAPNANSGWGRIDLKNTLNAQYAVFDDHLQGLSTGQTLSYTLQIAGSNNAGTLLVDQPARVGATDTIRISATSPLAPAAAAPANPAGWRLKLVPGFDGAAGSATIPSGNRTDKAGLTQLYGRTPPPARQGPGNAVIAPANGLPAIDSFLFNMVGGGDFEEPGWTSIWSKVWLGFGVPEITNAPAFVLSGQQSLWLGGTPSNDSVWYPLSFPETIDASTDSYLDFIFRMGNLDVNSDYFCYALTDESGNLLGADLAQPDSLEGCVTNVVPGQAYQFTLAFNAAQKAALEDQTGYLVLYNTGNSVAPHMSAFVDDVVLAIDFPDTTLDSTPPSGPAGTTFLLEGSNNTPYGPVQICLRPCSNPQNIIDTAYADARGALLAYIETNQSIQPGAYAVETADYYGRTAHITINVTGASQPALTVSPASGPAGARFTLAGSNFVPNDTQIALQINGQAQGVIGSDDKGALTFTLQTSSNTPPGAYTVQATDSGGGSASVVFTVTAVPGGSPTMTVAPAAGPPGSSFTFTSRGFTPGANVSFSLDGQSLGQTAADAAGGFQITLNTNANIPPATYTLVATQAARQASAQFKIAGAGGPTPSGRGIYVTLAWTDPPAQANATSTLINNLDLRVVGPGGTQLGNGGSTADTRNNVEGVRIENPSAGTYTIYVTATSVNGTFGAQPFALIATTAQNFGANTTNTELGRRVYLPLIRR